MAETASTWTNLKLDAQSVAVSDKQTLSVTYLPKTLPVSNTKLADSDDVV